VGLWDSCLVPGTEQRECFFFFTIAPRFFHRKKEICDVQKERNFLKKNRKRNQMHQALGGNLQSAITLLANSREEEIRQFAEFLGIQSLCSAAGTQQSTVQFETIDPTRIVASPFVQCGRECI
jgi:hypothetical protein